MRLFIIIPTFLCLFGVVLAQMATPLDGRAGQDGRFRHRRGADAGKGGKGKGKGGDQPVQGGVEALKARIGDLRSQAAKANDTLVPFKGGGLKGLVGLLKVNAGVSDLGSSIDLTIKTAEATKPLTVDESIQIGTGFLAFQPEINNLLVTLQGKREDFDKAGFKILDVRSLIHDDLILQKDKGSELGDAFVKILDKSLAPAAMQVVDQITKNFTKTIDTFDGRGGKIKIPAQIVPQLSDLLAGVAKALGLGGDTGKGNGKGNKALTTEMMRSSRIADDDTGNAAALPFPPTNFGTNVDAAADVINAADTPEAGTAIEVFIAGTSDAELARLGPDENDLRGVPPLVLAVLRRYGVI